MVSRNKNQFVFRLGLISAVIGAIGLILCCVGVGLPSWYLAFNANNTINVAQANLFYACFIQNFSQTTGTPSQVCTAYTLYSCSTSAYQNSALNVTVSLSGCTNPSNGSAAYAAYAGPISQVSIDDFYQIRSAAALSIVTILFLFVSGVFSLLVALLKLNLLLVFLPSIFGVIGVIFGVACLELTGSVFISNGTGYILYIVGVALYLPVILLMSIVAGRMCSPGSGEESNEDEDLFHRTDSAPVVHARRVIKRRIIN